MLRFNFISSRNFIIWLFVGYLLGFCVPSRAQVSEGGVPHSFINPMPSSVRGATMAPIDVQKLLGEDSLEASFEHPVPFRFGYAFDVDLGLGNAGTWDTLQNGDRIWRLRLSSPHAYSINLIFSEFSMPQEGKLFIYNLDKTMVIGAFTSNNNMPHGKFATQPVKGDAIILEYYEPVSVRGLGKLQVSKVIHAYRDVFNKIRYIKKQSPGKSVRSFGDSGPCNVNVNCPEGASWQNEKRSVAMILLNNNTRICTGSLVNDARKDGTPYFLTAFHCVDANLDNTLSSSEIQDAQTWIIMFNYESPTCSNQDGPTNYTISGTTFRAGYYASDFALVQLSQIPPNSYNLYYCGWSRENAAPSSVVAIHHPAGDVKKISIDNEPPVSTTYGGVLNSHWFVDNWDIGTTQPGSSGSPLYDPNHRIIGQDHAGDGYPPCDPLKGTYFGKFAVSWNYGTSSSTRLKDWLDPDNAGTLTIDGIEQLRATISGPTELYVGQYGTWTAAPSGGSGSYTYKWYVKSDDPAAGGNWVGPVSYTNTYTTQMHDFDKYLRLRADVTSGLQNVSAYHYVTCVDCSPGPGPLSLSKKDSGSAAEGSKNTNQTRTESFHLEQNHPNPFNPTTKISFSLPEAANVKLIVFDVNGREVMQLLNGFLNVGQHSVTFDGSNLSSGVYFYRIQAGKVLKSRPMMLLK